MFTVSIHIWCFIFIFLAEAHSVILVHIMPNLIPQIWYASFVSAFMNTVLFYFLRIVSLQHIHRSAVMLQYYCAKVLDFLTL